MSKYTNKITLMLLLSTIITALLCIIYSMQLYTYQHDLYTNAQIQAQNQTIQTADDINNFILQLKPIVHGLVNRLNSASITTSELDTYLKTRPIDISGFGVAYQPYAFDQNIRLFAPYAVESKGKRTLVDIGKKYDYTKPKFVWFHDPLNANGMFHELYSRPDKQFLIEYAEPFYTPGHNTHGSPDGIVFANQSAQNIKQVLSTRYLGKNGYWFIVNKAGQFIVHPNTNLVQSDKSIHMLAKQQPHTDLPDTISHILSGEQTISTYDNEITNTKSWLISAPIPEANWSLCGVFDLEEIPTTTDHTRHYYFIIIAMLICALVSCIILILIKTSMYATHLWIAIGCVSLTFSGGIVGLWLITYAYPDYIDTLTTIQDKENLYTYVTKFIPDTKNNITENSFKTVAAHNEFLHKNKRIIPTGIYISHLNFTTEQEVDIVGYVWQRYVVGLHDKLARGFMLPQAKESTIEKIYDQTINNVQIIIWRVQATLDQKLTYYQYPFDVKDIQVQLWHTDFSNGIMLIPDFDSYQIINPRSLPGFNNETYLSGWHIQASNFGYQQKDYRTLFGIYKQGEFGLYKETNKSDTPELYFHIKTQRSLLDTLISDLLPLLVIALLLFIILLMSTHHELSVISSSVATIFFGTVIAQIRFRNKIPTSQLAYFENLFFIMYGLMVSVLITSLLYHFDFNIHSIKAHKNRISKLLFWPVLLGALFIITLWYLY